MLAERCKVMIVEDVVENQVLLEEVLGEEYDLSIADSAEVCLERLPSDQPDLILLDVGLPGMNGYEVCREVKSNRDTRNIPIIFVSGGATSEERLAGYEAGGDEYVTKPFAVQDLLNKVEDSLRAKQDELYLQQTIKEAKELAREALISSSELGALNLFMQQSGHAMSYDELADNLLRATKSFGLQCSVAVHASVASYFFGCDPGSLEADMLEKCKDRERFVELQGRTVINAKHCSLLVKNMPLEGDEKSSRLLEHLGAIVDAAAARIASLQYMLDKHAQRTSTIRQLLRSNDTRLSRIKAQVTENETQVRKLTTELRLKMEQQLVMMELDDDKEMELLQTINEGINALTELPDLNDEIESSFRMTNDTLYRLLD